MIVMVMAMVMEMVTDMVMVMGMVMVMVPVHTPPYGPPHVHIATGRPSSLEVWHFGNVETSSKDVLTAMSNLNKKVVMAMGMAMDNMGQ